MSHHTDWLPAILINKDPRCTHQDAFTSREHEQKFEKIIPPHIYTNQMLTVVSVDSSSRRRQPFVAASLCFGHVPGYSPARATDASPAQLARAPTQTPVSKNQLCVKLVNIVLLVKLLIHVFWYVRKNSSSTFNTLSHSMKLLLVLEWMRGFLPAPFSFSFHF